MVCGVHALAHASVMEIDARHGAVSAGPPPAMAPAPASEGVTVIQPVTSDLAEPAVFAMMLLGLCLIGYRARRDSSETFK